jgi:hypothetical protein
MIHGIVAILFVLVGLYFIYRWTVKKWKEAEMIEKEDLLDEGIKESGYVNKAFNKSKRINGEKVRMKREKVNEVLEQLKGDKNGL